ncbi:Putative dual specificity tyrosine-phosphorylation-regulated kinase 3 homolog [Eumeta japonica]|uniref:dual-specificity kinase n=1 Tax=Eumeta variegata TaxID=151549 RepID=A0A4C1UQC4_EUMVA|nr:Putative dual specificity tyrosine-phosphorylation-regulated kinase 3 homolog [Eumeta japonica]
MILPILNPQRIQAATVFTVKTGSNGAKLHHIHLVLDSTTSSRAQIAHVCYLTRSCELGAGERFNDSRSQFLFSLWRGGWVITAAHGTLCLHYIVRVTRLGRLAVAPSAANASASGAAAGASASAGAVRCSASASRECRERERERGLANEVRGAGAGRAAMTGDMPLGSAHAFGRKLLRYEGDGSLPPLEPGPPAPLAANAQPPDKRPAFAAASPEQVMKLYMNKLTPYEHREIYDYPQVYFIGANAKKRPGLVGFPNNCEYDNEQGSYIHIAHDHIAYRYEVLKVIGKGSFGQVVKAYDHKKRENVALKMVRNEKRFHRQAQEEIRILEHLREQDKDNTMNVIHMFDSFTFRNHTCITFELLSINLYELIKKNKFQGFSLQLVRKFSHSLLQCLHALNKNRIIHCDMKPENVLLKQQGRSGIKARPSKGTCLKGDAHTQKRIDRGNARPRSMLGRARAPHGPSRRVYAGS